MNIDDFEETTKIWPGVRDFSATWRLSNKKLGIAVEFKLEIDTHLEGDLEYECDLELLKFNTKTNKCACLANPRTNSSTCLSAEYFSTYQEISNEEIFDELRSRLPQFFTDEGELK